MTVKIWKIYQLWQT